MLFGNLVLVCWICEEWSGLRGGIVGIGGYYWCG